MIPVAIRIIKLITYAGSEMVVVAIRIIKLIILWQIYTLLCEIAEQLDVLTIIL